MPDLLGLSRARTIAEQAGLPLVDLEASPADPDLATAFPDEVLHRLDALPYQLADGVLWVAVAQPQPEVAAELARYTQHRLELVVAPADEIEARLGATAAVPGDLGGELEFEGVADQTSPAFQLVAGVLRRAAGSGASHAHLVPVRGGLQVRLRVDGVVHELDEVVGPLSQAVITALKTMAKLDIAERRRPQSGRFSIRSAGSRAFDIGVTVLPTVAGEGVVLRLLEKSRTAPSLSELGLSNTMQMELERVVGRSIGALLVTGPTGCGKSTTVYAALADLARPEVNVVTVEEPVEYELPGTFQVQVDLQAGATFPASVGSVLRGDPDVLMVGELRDPETAQLAIGAALAGRFVLTTLHANDAPGALTRLVEMGVEPYAVASGVSAVIAQRLARRLCLHCREPYRPAADVLAGLAYPPERVAAGDVIHHRAIGCPHCHGGYHGRVGLFQLLLMSDELRRLAAAGAGHAQLEQAARSAGAASLWADGLGKVEAGVTSLDELYRVLA